MARPREEPLVITLNEPLTSEQIRQLRSLIFGVARQRPIIVDVTTITGFDSEGASELLALQDEVGSHRLVVVGFRQAAARLFGLATLFGALQADIPAQATPEVRPTPGMVLVEIKPDSSAAALQLALRSAVDKDIAIVVVDLDAVVTITLEVLDALTTASRDAASRGQELVLLNVSDEAATILDRVGLAATTYLAVTV